MASRGLGSLTLDLILKMGGFEQGMDKAARLSQKRMKQISISAFAAGNALGQFLHDGIVAVARALPALVQGAIDQADAMRDLSIRVGVSTEVLSAYGYAAKQTGTDMDALSKGMKILAKNAADALNPTSEQAKVFDALGISVTDSAGKLKNLDRLVPEIADKFKQLEDGTTKAALAQALFGKSGLELTEFLNQGADGLDTFAQKAAELGIIIDSKTAAAADEFNDTLGDLKAVISGLGLGIARELLPVMKDTVQGLVDLVKQGSLAADIASVLGAAFSVTTGVLSGYTKAVRLTTLAMENAVVMGQALYEINKNLQTLGFADGSVAGGLQRIRDQKAASDRERAEILGGKKRGLFDDVISTSSTVAAGGLDSRKIANALSNPSASRGGGKRSGGKSEAEREADQLKAAYDRLIASQNEQIALFGKTTEAAQVRYDTEFGDLKNLTQAQKDSAIANAERLDQMRDEMDVQKELDDINRRRVEATADVLADIAAERDLLGATIEQQDTYNKLKYAGVDANSAFGQSIIAANQALHEQAKAVADQTELMDTFRSEASSALADVVKGTKSLGDAFKDMFDNIAAKITEMIANKWIEQLFGEQGSTSGGSAGGWMSLLGSLFGGGKASGGPVSPSKFYEVGEGDRPELLYAGGKQYLIPGNQGRVVPMTGSSGGGVNQTLQFFYAAPPSPRTQSQTADRVAFETRRSARNR